MDKNCFRWVSAERFGFCCDMGEGPALLHRLRGVVGKELWEAEKWEPSGEALAGALGPV